MDYSDVDADRQLSHTRTRSRSRSRSRSRTPRPDDRRPVSRSRSPPPRRYRDDSRSPPPRRGDYDSRRDYNRDRTPDRSRYSNRDRSPPSSLPPPPKPKGVPEHVEASNVVGVFGLSIRTVESDLEHEFGRIAPVEKVVIVYDARSGRSRGFGFITMKDQIGASDVIKALNGKDLHGRRIRVDYSTTHKPHDPTPGIYKGEPRADDRSYRSESRYGGGGGGASSYRRGGDSYYSRGPPASGRGGSDSYRRRYDADVSDDWRRAPRRDRRSISPPRRREYTRSPSPRRYDREERVPPPSRSRHGSHLDSPPRDEDVEPARYY